MKRMLCFILVVAMLFLCACASKTTDWQTIYIKECGTLKIPNEWNYWVEDGIHYITEGETPIMISCKCTGESESNKYFSDYRYVDFVSSAGLSNSAIYGKANYLYGNNINELYYLSLGYTYADELIEFVVWNPEIDKEMLVRIAETFVMD